MVDDLFNLKGRVSIELNGQTVQKIDNLVVTAGKVFVASRMKDAAAVGNTALGAESARVALTSTTPSSATVVYVATFPAGTGTAALTEAGILNASSGGTMLCRTVFTAINKGSADAMTVTWTITVS